MRVGKRVTETVTRVKYYGVFCDICDKDVEECRKGAGAYDETEVTIEAYEGSIYPGDDCRDHYEIDICFDCFEDKVKPAIESLAIRPFRESGALSGRDYYQKIIEEENEEAIKTE